MRNITFGRVEVVCLGQTGIGFAKSGRNDAVTWRRVLTTDERAKLRVLILALPNGPSARCHMPGFGLRIGRIFRRRVSICFRCNNAYLGSKLTTFDASSAAASELRAFLRGLAPADAPSPAE